MTRGTQQFSITQDDFDLRAYVMFQGTKPENVEGILNEEFRHTTKGNDGWPQPMLGKGIYTTRDSDKAENVQYYGTITLKLIVYTGTRKVYLDTPFSYIV